MESETKADFVTPVDESAGCNDGPNSVTTAFIPTDGACYGVSPIVSGNTDSGIISQSQLAALPAGCTRKYSYDAHHLDDLLSLIVVVWSDNTCSSVNFIEYTATGECGTFGPDKFIHSARAVGTCA